MPTSRFDYVLRLADNPLILGQRLSEWCGHAPVLEEDLALANVALDLIGQARLLLAHASALDDKGRDEDRLAFLRLEFEYCNFTLAELPNDDFAATVVRNLLFSAYQVHLWEALRRSSDSELAAIAGKSIKETRYHVRHAADWTVRLGDGTEESHARVQAALDGLWPYTSELFAPDAVEDAAAADGYGVSGASLQPRWEATVRPVLEEATLRAPERTPFRSRGKHGVHSEHMGHLLTEMQYMQRAYPGLQW
jgi:ring-1,2-phenylacetyl-CoA epoxidase subunit PaaC